MEDKKEEKVDVKNEDVIEDIEDIEEIEETPKENDESSKINTASNEEELVSDDVILEDTSNNDNSETDSKTSDAEETLDNEVLNAEKKNNKKIPIIVLLSILLVIDIAALVIYLIGIEKVISFIK